MARIGWVLASLIRSGTTFPRVELASFNNEFYLTSHHTLNWLPLAICKAQDWGRGKEAVSKMSKYTHPTHGERGF